MTDNPLPPCPDTPNCERISRAYDISPRRLYAAVQKALESLGPTQLHLHPDTFRAEAVYRVGLVFKDDVDVVVEPMKSAESSHLHVRSASRVGYRDFGVNRRRIQRFLNAVRSALK